MLSRTQQLTYNFVHCGAKLYHARQTVGKRSPFLQKKLFVNIWHYMQMNGMDKSLSYSMFIRKCNFLQLSLKINAIFSIF